MADEKAVQKFQETTMELVLKKVNAFTEAGSLQLPKDYSVSNAMRGAWLVLQELKDKDNKPVLTSCTPGSIANALLDMATQGMSVQKKQGAFIVYGNKVVFQRMYAGNVALAKRYAGMKEVRANVIYKDDVFEYGVDAETGRKHIIEHKTKIQNIDFTKLLGAYALVIMEDGSTYLEVMSMAQIKQSWEQGQSKGNSPAHRNFPDQQMIKTVINRAIKILISASDDSVLMENLETNRKIESVKETIAENANHGEPLDITHEEIPEEIPEPPAEVIQPEQPEIPIETEKKPKEKKGPGF